MASSIAPTVLDYNQTEEDGVYPIAGIDSTDSTKEDDASVIGIEITNEAILEVNSTDSSEIPTIVAPPAATINYYNGLTWETCDYSLDGDVIGVQGTIWKNLPVAKLRNICSKLQVYGVKNCKKDFIIETIIKTYNNMMAYNKLKMTVGQFSDSSQQPTRMANLSSNTTDNATTRKEVQCVYRLISILFSDDFAEEFANLGNAPSRSAINSRKVAFEEGFWKKIELAYPVNKLNYNLFNFHDDDVFLMKTLM
jgi:hypothetical protein